MKSDSQIKLIKNSIKQFKLDLSDLNILIPINPIEPSIMPLLANLSGAKQIYVQTNNISAINEISVLKEEDECFSNINIIEKETPQILSNIDIVIKGEDMSQIDTKYLASINKNAIISIYPDNFDFLNVQNINLEECTNKKIPVVTVNPNDKNLMLYKYISQVVLKRFMEINLDIFRSKVLLIGSDELFDNTLSLLKACGSHVYSANLNISTDKSYILKHLGDSEAIIVVDYPQKYSNIIGTDGFITIEDILNINPEIKIIHLAGKLQVNPLTLGKIFYTPDKIKQGSLSINKGDLGIRCMIDTAAASMKVAETIIKIKNRSVLSSDSVVSYKIVNADGPTVLGRIMF